MKSAFVAGTFFFVLSSVAVVAQETTSINVHASRTYYYDSRNEGYWIYMDDRCLGRIYDSETKDIRVDEVSLGEHTFKLRVDLLGLSAAEFAEFHRAKDDNLDRKIYIDKDDKVDIKIGWKDKVVYYSVKSTASLKLPPNSSVVKIDLNKRIKHVILKESPPIKIARGTEKTIEDTIRVVHSVTISEGWKTETDVRAKLNASWVQYEAGIRTGIEKSTNKSYGTETERKRGVVLRGDGASKRVRVVWVDCYRTGTATLMVDGKEVRVPFEFKEDFDLLTEDADD